MEENDFLKIKTSRDKEEGQDSEEEKPIKKPKHTENLIKLESIEKYKKKKLEEWDKRSDDFNLKEFVTNIYDIHNESQKIYMETIIFHEKEEFISHYSKYQFILDINTRKEFQNKFKNDEDIMKTPIISKNIIPENCISIRNIFTNILLNIFSLNINYENIASEIKNIFIDNKVYFNFLFDYLIPTRFSDNYEYKYNKLLLDIAHIFFPWENILDNQNFTTEEIDNIFDRFELFKSLELFGKKINLFLNDDDLIDNCEFLFNILEILLQVESEKRNMILFDNMIGMCIPFEIEVAKSKLLDMKKSILNGLYIDNINILDYDIEQLTKDSNITIKTKKGRKQITIKANELNWYLGDKLIKYFHTDNFMICFSYKSSLNKNYLKLKQDLNDNFKALFKRMIQSPITKDAMSQDSEAKQFEYPFLKEDIFEECINCIHYVPFPVSSFYGYTDKNSFKTYIYINISVDNTIKVFTEFDNLLKTKAHEFKHLSRIYFHLFKRSISLNTPKTNKNNKKDLALIGENLEKMEKKIKNIKEVYKTRTISFPETNEMDYGDIFELFLTGVKSTKFFLANSIFCLKETSWNLTIEQFANNYNNSIAAQKILIQKNKKNWPFITSVLENFNIKSNAYYINEITYKDAYKKDNPKDNSDVYENECLDKETYSHYNFPK